MEGNSYTRAVVDWNLVAAEVSRRLGMNSRGRPYSPVYIRKVRAGTYNSRHVAKVLEDMLGPVTVSASTAATPATPTTTQADQCPATEGSAQ